MAETAGTTVTLHHNNHNSLNGGHVNVAIDLIANGTVSRPDSGTTITGNKNSAVTGKQDQEDRISRNGDCTSNGHTDHQVDEATTGQTNGETVITETSEANHLHFTKKESECSSMEETDPQSSSGEPDVAPESEDPHPQSVTVSSPSSPGTASASTPAAESAVEQVSEPATVTKGPKMTTGRKSTASGQSAQSSSGRKGHHPHHGPGDQASSRMSHVAEMPLRLVVNSEMVGAIIGKSGGTIRDITQKSKARVDVLRKEASGSLDKVINIFGSIDACNKACSKIMEVIAEEARNTDRDPDDYPLRLLAHNALIGRIIGKSGSSIKRVMEGTGTKVTISPTLFDPSAYTLPERVVTIQGPDLVSVIDAESQIFNKLRTCYESDMALAVAPSFMPPYASSARLTHPHLSHMMTQPVVSGSGSSSRGSGGGSHGSGASGHGAPFSPTSVYGPAFLSSPSVSLLPQFPFQVPAMNPVTSASVQSMMPIESGKETAVIYIPNSCVGAVIGTGGGTIREMMHSSGASIKVAQSPKDQDRGKGEEDQESAAAAPAVVRTERRVTVTGTPESQWKAQMFIFRKVLMDPSVSSSSSSEPVLRVEIMVPSNQVGRIIGKNGQTVRELQRLTRAQIKLPEPADSSSAPPPPDAETPVSIVGDFFSSQNAQRQIRALVSRGQMSSMMMSGNPAFDLTGMSFQRIRDDRRQGPDYGSFSGSAGVTGRGGGAKNKSSKSGSGRQSHKQPTPASHSSQADEAAPPAPPPTDSPEADEYQSTTKGSDHEAESQAAADPQK